MPRLADRLLGMIPKPVKLTLRLPGLLWHAFRVARKLGASAGWDVLRRLQLLLVGRPARHHPAEHDNPQEFVRDDLKLYEELKQQAS